MAEERARRLWRLYRLSLDDYAARLEQQGGACGVCGRTEATSTGNVSFAVDHDHRCCQERGRSCGRCVRGLLDGGCNGLLGFYELCLKPAMEADLLCRLNAYLRRFPRPGGSLVPGRAAGPRRRGIVTVEYYPAWLRDHKVIMYGSIQRRRAWEDEEGQARLDRLEEGLDEFFSTGWISNGTIRLVDAAQT